MADDNTDLRLASIVYTLKSCKLFSDLPPADLNEIAEFAAVSPVEKGERLENQASGRFRELNEFQSFRVWRHMGWRNRSIDL